MKVEASHAPLDAATLERAIAALENGARFKEVYEELLLEVSADVADRTMQLQREARGAWLLLSQVALSMQRRAKVLLIANALSGASVPLAHFGFEVTLWDRSALRLRFAELRNRALVPTGVTHTVQADDGPRLPFGDGAFDLVVQENSASDEGGTPRFEPSELRRVTRGEVLLIADNRFAYKTSSGRRGVFEVPSAFQYAARLLSAHRERSLRGYRALFRVAGLEGERAFALYPHAREFTYVVALDAQWPRLAVGPQERRNRWKVLAHALGLFPVLAPSFAVFATKHGGASQPSRVERILDGLAERTGEPRPELEHLVATRGNSALLLTRHGARERVRDTGWWCVHIGLSPAQRVQLARHMEFLAGLRARFPSVPVPQPLFEGEIDGVTLTCERRSRGLTTPQFAGRPLVVRAITAQLSERLAELVCAPPSPLSESEFERLIGARLDLVARFAREPSTVAALERMKADARAALLGRSFPRVVYHADLRGKHVQAEDDGRIAALLDWGSAEWCDLPYFDLLHFIAHERKQSEGISASRAWQIVRERVELFDWEREALDRYAQRVGLDDTYRRAIEALYPALVAAMAESHWDFSRPLWLRRQFGVGADQPAQS